MLLFILAPVVLLQVVAALERGQKCTKVVKIPSSVKTVGAYISCPLPFGKNKSLEGLVADSSTKKLTCDYDTGVVCRYDLKTGKKVAKSGKSCPATTAKPTGCGKLCHTGCPAKNVAGNKNTAVNLYWDSLDQFTSMLCLYGERRCYYEYTGNLWTLEENDPDCPERSAAKPGFCLLRR